mmetsp:Transcript_445/g.1829  ORF Transcript_445/g.1829 Transcript_445/m.1829 type:complete len:477 (-) Transcript_445:1658-3088(-)
MIYPHGNAPHAPHPSTSRSHDGGDLELQLGRLLLRRGGRLGRAHRHHLGLRPARGFERLAKGAEVLLRGAQHLLAALLALVVLHLEQVAHERGVALGVGELVRVQVAHGADDGLGELLALDVQAFQKVHRAVVVGHRLHQVGVAVGQVREHAAVRVKVGEPAVRAAGDAHAVPQPGGPEQLVDHVRRAVQVVPRRVQVRALAHVVHLRGHGDELVHRREHERGGPGFGGRARAGGGQRVQEGLHRGRGGLERLGVRGEVSHRAGARDDGGANRLQVRHDAVPVLLDAFRQNLEVLQLREAAQLLVDVARDGVHGVEAPGGDGVPAGLHARLGAGARLEDELLENLAVVELRLEKHLRHEVVQHARVGGGGLAAEHEVRGDVVSAADARGERREREPAGGRADGLVKLHEVTLRRAHALHGAAPQRHQRHQLHGDRVQVHEVLGVQNLGGGDVVREHLGGADGGDVGGNGLGLLGDV